MSFNNGDRVKRVNGVPLVGIVMYKIEVPPPRWDENGETQISYQIQFPTIGTHSIVDEGELVIVETPLI